MSKLESILAGILGVGLASSTLLIFSPVARENVMAMMPKLQPAKVVEPAPVVVTDPGDDVVNITTTEGKTFTVMRKNVKCRTKNNLFDQDELIRYCDVNGVMTDLAGHKTHYTEVSKICFRKENQYANWTNGYEINSMACSAAIDFGKS